MKKIRKLKETWRQSQDNKPITAMYKDMLYAQWFVIISLMVNSVTDVVDVAYMRGTVKSLVDFIQDFLNAIAAAG